MRAGLWRIWVAALLVVVALTTGTYSFAAQWWNSYLQSQVIKHDNDRIKEGPQEDFDAIRERANEYNERWKTGQDTSDYLTQLNPFGGGVMGRIKIDKIDVDLPIFHTSNDDVLRRGAGHMPETSLPVGGQGTHAAITAHRGLAQSTLFTNLDKVEVGDQFVLEVLGEPLVYQVAKRRIVDADELHWFERDGTKDQVTLITCNPLGINTERILVTGERVFPTPASAIENLGADSDHPHFPWWLVIYVSGLVLTGVVTRRSYRRAKAGLTESSSAS